MRTKCVAVMLLAVASVGQAADTLPTPEELQQLVADKKWPEVMAGATRILALKGPATDAYDRYDVWLKKGEAQIQSNLIVPASQSFAKAADEKKATPDQIDDARALALLTKKSDAKGYRTPARAGSIKSYDIRDPAKRGEAMAALLSAEGSEVARRVEAAKPTTEVRPLVELARQIGDLKSLDRVVNKSSEKSDTLETTMATNFIANTRRWSASVDKEVERIRTRADETITENVRDANGRTFVRQGRRGFMGNDATDALKMIRAGEQWAETYKAVRDALGDVGRTALEPAENVIQTAYDKAKTLQGDALRPPMR